MSRRHQETPESYVQSAVLELLTVERIWHVRLNSRTVMLPGRSGRLRPVFFGSPGMADILATPTLGWNAPQEIAVLWIECKDPEKGKQSDSQKLFQASAEEAGHYYLLARSVDDVRDWLTRVRGQHV